MKILVANVGSTSYKYTLFEIEGVTCIRLAKGAAERVEDYLAAIGNCLEDLRANAGIAPADIDAVAFKTVLGKNLSGLREVDEEVLKALSDMAFVAPAHNPPYIAAIRAFEKALPSAKRIALFETSFFQWAPRAWRRYAVPKSWDEAGVRRNGFHGASHKYAAQRAAELCGRFDAAESAKMLYVNGGPEKLQRPFRLINCHLGGSSSVCGILNGAAIGSSMGFTPQSGLPQNNRTGDLDSMALPFVVETLKISLGEAARQLSKESGLLGISGVSNDIRDIHSAAQAGNEDAALAIDVLVHSAKMYIGGFAAQLGGVDCISFSGGIGENDTLVRERILESLEFIGLKLDAQRNAAMKGKKEGEISAEDSAVKAVVVSADEEIVLASEAARLIESGGR